MRPPPSTLLTPRSKLAAPGRSNLRPGLVRALVAAAWAFALPVQADNLAEAQKLIRQGQYPLAQEKVDAQLAASPKDAQARFLKGVILTETNRPVEAIAVFTRLTEDYPELPEPYNNLAVLYAQQKQYDKARAALEMAIRTHPSYATAHENLGDIYARLARQAYDKALQLDGGNATAQNKLALIREINAAGTRPGGKDAKATARPVATAATPTPPAPPAGEPAPPVKPLPPRPEANKGEAGKHDTMRPAESKPEVKAEAKTETKPEVKTAARPDAKPEGKGDSAPAKPDPASEDIRKALAGWANAWMKKDMRAYFAAYAADFTPPDGLGRKAWEKEREQRIAGKSGKIVVRYDNPRITVDGALATVRFRQHYTAPGFNSSAEKVMIFTRSGGKWLIKEEKSR